MTSFRTKNARTTPSLSARTTIFGRLARHQSVIVAFTRKTLERFKKQPLQTTALHCTCHAHNARCGNTPQNHKTISNHYHLHRLPLLPPATLFIARRIHQSHHPRLRITSHRASSHVSSSAFTHIAYRSMRPMVTRHRHITLRRLPLAPYRHITLHRLPLLEGVSLCFSMMFTFLCH